MTTSTSLIAPAALRSADWPVLTELRPDAAQSVFHDMMEAMSRPGTIRNLAPYAPPAPVPAALTPVLTLADLMSPLAVLETDLIVEEEREHIGGILSRLTGAPLSDAAGARFALALAEPNDWSDLCCGTHWSPEYGAMLVQRVETLTGDDRGERSLRLTGPGIRPGEPTVISVTGLSDAWFEQRNALTSSYPAGIDCVLVADDGTFVCLPRTTEIEVI